MSRNHRLTWWTYVIIVGGASALLFWDLLFSSGDENTIPWLYVLFTGLIISLFGIGGEKLEVFNSTNDTVIVVGLVAMFLSLPFVYFLYVAFGEIEFAFANYTYSIGGFILCLVPAYIAFLGVPLVHYSPF